MSDARTEPPPTPAPVEPHHSAPQPGWLTIPRRLACLTAILAAALLCGFLLSPKLWLSTRSFPLTPVWDRLPPIPPPFDVVWFGGMLLLLPVIAVVRRPRWWIVALLVLACASGLWDQSRWQPWFYQYLALFGALAWASWKPDCPQAQQAALNTSRLIVAATYGWSGIQKLNATFLAEVYPWLLHPVLPVVPEFLRPLVTGAGFVVPFVETGLGLGLLLRRLRPLAVGGAVVMHLLLLLVLGPTGRNYNSIVWPWNAAMAAMVIVLFWRTPAVTARSVLWPARSAYARVVLLLFGVLPGLHLVGLWDSYLSAALYSGNTLDGHVLVPLEQADRLPDDVQADLEPGDDGWDLNVSSWSMRDLNVPAFPARRVYRHVAQVLAARCEPPADLYLVIDEQPDLVTGRRRETTISFGRGEKIGPPGPAPPFPEQ
jgi:hypothetical protein